MIPVYIISRDRVSLVQALAQQVELLPGCVPIIIDNASTYELMTQWLSDCPYEVVRMTEQQNDHRSVWWYHLPPPSEFIQKWGQSYYCVSDCDLDIAAVPLDCIDILKIGLDGKQDIAKCGVSLSLNELHPYWRDQITRWERRWWKTKEVIQGYVYYRGMVDTTFALFNVNKGGEYKSVCNATRPALRAGPPYTAKHIPWYIHPQQWSEEDKYYYSHMDKKISWTYTHNAALNPEGIKYVGR